jgi:hypothetical protein
MFVASTMYSLFSLPILVFVLSISRLIASNSSLANNLLELQKINKSELINQRVEVTFENILHVHV